MLFPQFGEKIERRRVLAIKLLNYQFSHILIVSYFPFHFCSYFFLLERDCFPCFLFCFFVFVFVFHFGSSLFLYFFFPHFLGLTYEYNYTNFIFYPPNFYIKVFIEFGGLLGH